MSQPIIYPSPFENRRGFNAHPINGALSISMYSINRALRGLQPFGHGCGVALAVHGWRNEQQFAQALQEAFYDLHVAGHLGRRQGDIAYRGDWLSPERMASIRLGGTIHDSGYSFATPSAKEAWDHLGEDEMIQKGVYTDPDNPLTPVILRIVVGQASLYLPRPDEDDPLGLSVDGDNLANLPNGQFILDRNSVLKVKGVSEHVPDPQHLDQQITMVECEQIL